MAIAAATKIRDWREDPVLFVREVFGVEPDAWQYDVLRNFKASNRIAMKAAKGPGKMEPCDKVIYTPFGKTRFGDLRIGSSVFAEDGSCTTVTGVFPQGEQDIYRVHFDDKTHCDVGLEHLWKVRGRYEKRKKIWSVLSTKEIIDRGVEIKQGTKPYFQFQIPQQGPAQFKKRALPIHPYTLGVWLGDGTRLKTQITTADLDIVNKIEFFGNKVRENKTSIDKCPQYSILGIGDGLRILCMIDKYSYEKSVPNIYKTSSVEDRLNLLRGLMDTDGTIDKDDSNCTFSSTSRKLAEDVAWIVRSLSGKAIIRKPKKTTHRDCYNVSVTLPMCPFFLERKAFLWKKPSQDRYFMRTIKKIDKIGRKEAMCIQVDHHDSCYLTNDFIVTHNTAVLAWLIWNFLATRPHPKMAATSITSDNLSDNLWPELAKWQNKSAFLKQKFVWRKTRVEARDHPETWFCSARTWAKGADASQQADTLAGLHADYLLFVLDEVGGIPDAVMASAEAGLATGIETKILMAGNPTHTEGPLWRACSTERHLWHVVEITGDPDDPKRSPRISKQWAKEQIEKYGKDNPWVMVNVFGKFPPSSLNTLFGPEEVRAAMNRHLRSDAYDWAQKRLGVDVSRYGDDRTVIFPRQGLAAFQPIIMRHKRNDPVSVDIAMQVEMAKAKWGSDVELLDATGGWAAGTYDVLISHGYSPTGVDFSSKKTYSPKYFNVRAEMWFRMSEWLRKGAALPNIPELVGELTTPTYTFRNGQFMLEPKEDVKERLQRSPDLADGLALTFALPEAPREEVMRNRIAQMTSKKDSNLRSEYDHLAEK